MFVFAIGDYERFSRKFIVWTFVARDWAFAFAVGLTIRQDGTFDNKLIFVKGNT